MTGSVDFYWFSGTGNTLVVVREMANVFRQAGIPVRLIPLRADTEVAFEEDVTLGIGVPVAEQGTYPFVLEFCRRLPEGLGREVFFVDTLLAYSGGIVGPLKTLLSRKGYRPIGAREITMPNNLFPREVDPEKTAAKREKGLTRARDYARSLIDGKARWRRVPLLPWIWAGMNRSKRIWELMGRWAGLRCDAELCTRCGLCERLCPVGNILMEDVPVFSGRCRVCLRCYSLCPAGAVVSAKRPGRARYRAVTAVEMLEAERGG